MMMLWRAPLLFFLSFLAFILACAALDYFGEDVIGGCVMGMAVIMLIAGRGGNAKLDLIITGAFPFLIVMIACLLVITYVPALSMTLPNWLSK